MRGIHFVVNEEGEKTGVVIDLKVNAELWEDFYDLAVAKSREREFWSTHDSTEFVEWSYARRVTFPNLKPSTYREEQLRTLDGGTTRETPASSAD